MAAIESAVPPGTGVVSTTLGLTVWDVVKIANVTCPFVCKVGEAKRTSQWDVKLGKGTIGATTTYVGSPPAEFSIEFFLCVADHFAAWDTFRPLLKYNPAGTKKAVDIYHPSLASIDVSSVLVKSIGSVVHKGAGLYSITVEFMEYLPAPKQSAVSTPSGAIANAGGSQVPGTPPDSAADALQKQVARLLPLAAAP